MRFLPHRYTRLPEPVLSVSGADLPWVTEAKYLGITLQSDKESVIISLSANVRKYYAAHNSLHSTNTSIPWTTANSITKQYCLPVLHYGLQVCHLISERELNLLSTVQNKSIRQRGRFPFRSNVTATNTAASTEPLQIIAFKQASTTFQTLLSSTNILVRTLATRHNQGQEK